MVEEDIFTFLSKPKKKRTFAQDSYRETQMAIHCGLTLVRGRMFNDAVDDAGNPFELKSSTKCDTAFSTAREVTISMIEENWNSKYWIPSTGIEYSAGGTKTYQMGQLYIAHPGYLQEEFNRIKEQLLELEEITKIIRERCDGIEFIQRRQKLFDRLLRRGASLNDPKMRISAFKQNGIVLDFENSTNARKSREDYVKANPLEMKVKPPKKSALDEFFSII